MNKLLIVTSDIRYCVHANERFLPYIDSSIFGMSLLFALHFLKLGACPLMWANSPQRDRKLKAIAQIDKHHTIILLIAVGHLPRQFKVPKSPRLPIENIFYVR